MLAHGNDGVRPVRSPHRYTSPILPEPTANTADAPVSVRPLDQLQRRLLNASDHQRLTYRLQYPRPYQRAHGVAPSDPHTARDVDRDAPQVDDSPTVKSAQGGPHERSGTDSEDEDSDGISDRLWGGR